MSRGSWVIGSIAGIRIGLHPSWLIIAFLVTYSLAAFGLPQDFGGWDPILYWLVAGTIASFFFLSVLLHELSHAIVARRFGVKVSDITLFIFGGAASMEQEAETPRQEAVIAAAGPLSSLLLGGGLVAADLAIRQPQLDAVVGWLGFINLTLGAFNLLPGFPMDGGRILRAVLWRVRGDRYAATRNAAAVGRLFGYLLIGGGVWIAFQPGGVVGGLWLALIGWFLSSAAESTVSRVSLERSLRGVRVRDVMDPEPASVSPNESVAELVNQRMMRGEHRSFLVRHDDGGLAGIVTLSDVGRLPRESWEGARVTDIMTRWGDLARVGPDEEVGTALDLLHQREVKQLPVVEADGRTVVGLLTRTGVLRMIDTRLKLGV